MKNYSYYLDEDIDKNYFLYSVLNRLNKTKKLVIACIGTDRHIFDSFGPFVGTFLSELNLKNVIVYGTLNEPIHALNVNDKAKEIMENHKDDFVIAIDACVSKYQDEGTLFYSNSSIKPGKGTGKELEEIGHASIKYSTTESVFSFISESYRISKIYDAAKKVALIIKELDEDIEKEKEPLDEVSFDLFE